MVINWISLEEVCLPSFEVLNCMLNLVDSCLDDGNNLRLKVIAAFCSAIISFNSSPHPGKICLLVHGLYKISQLFPFVYTYAVLNIFIQSC